MPAHDLGHNLPDSLHYKSTTIFVSLYCAFFVSQVVNN